MDTTTNVYRPPPKRRRANPFNFLTPGVPFYRDVRVLRLFAQLAFLFLVVGAGYVLIANLTTNLTNSNLALDFGVYNRPFTVAIAEGPSLTSVWAWTRTPELPGILGNAIWILAGVLTLYTGFSLYRQYQHFEVKLGTVITIAILILLMISYPPAQLTEMLRVFLTEYLAPSTMTRAFFTGIISTLQVVFISLIACTLLGIFAGIGLLSSNILVRSVAQIYVEIFRNTPMVVQLIFIYRSLTLLLPAPRQSICALGSYTLDPNPCTLPGNLFILNARGFYVVQPNPTDQAVILLISVIIGVVIALFLRAWRLRRQEQTGQPAYVWRFMIPVLLIAIVGGWLLAGTPYTFNYPFLRGPNVQEGLQLSISFVALTLGLTLYTGAFIADIVRAGIQSVPFGQIEAARSQGFNGNQVLSFIVLPQALRLIIPPLGNQYVNLGKNSSLGIVVAYADTYRIAQLANNESGQAVPFFIGLMLIYLSISVSLSFMTNLINRFTRIKTR